MAFAKITDGRVWLHSYDVSGEVNNITLNGTAAELDATNMNSAGWREKRAGIKEAEASVAGFYDAASLDAAADALHGTNGIQTYAVDDIAGSVAYFGTGPILSVERGFPVGEMATMSVTAKATGGVRRGAILFPKTTATATANGAALQHGAVSASQTLWACLHVFSASAGDTLDVVVASDTASNFPSTTSRIAFTQIAGAVTGSEIKSLAGAITDDWWRVEYTIAGNGSESFSFAVSIAICTT